MKKREFLKRLGFVAAAVVLPINIVKSQNVNHATFKLPDPLIKGNVTIGGSKEFQDLMLNNPYISLLSQSVNDPTIGLHPTHHSRFKVFPHGKNTDGKEEYSVTFLIEGNNHIIKDSYIVENKNDVIGAARRFALTVVRVGIFR